jgi:4,5:9,10-diseco-3-hydroxy-5,9,17-trioxoandrosta-1(10),2-diene-4-oate hydrolase
MKTPQDRFIKVGNFNTRYWAEGTQGSPVILLHGIGEYVERWQPNFSVLAEKHQVYALDMLGQGHTDKPLNVSYKIADLAQFVKDFMTTLGIESAHVVGHSLGGAIATRLALVHPTAVNKLVLVSPGGLGKGGSLMLRIVSIPLLGEMLSGPSRASTTNFVKAVVHDPAVMTGEFFELAYQATLPKESRMAFLNILRANIDLFGQRKSMYGPNMDGLPSIKKPVLVIWGRQDQILPVAHAEVAAKSLPDVRVHIFDGCGHLPMLEKAQPFNELVLEFLGS